MNMIDKYQQRVSGVPEYPIFLSKDVKGNRFLMDSQSWYPIELDIGTQNDFIWLHFSGNSINIHKQQSSVSSGIRLFAWF